MYLLIDNSGEGKIILSYQALKKAGRRVFTGSEAADLLAALEKLLREMKVKPQDLKGLAVRVGAGRFTATRVAVTVANTLAFALKIPVTGVGGPDLAGALGKLKTAKPGTYLSATYSGAAHIGGKN